jgi:protein-S-isoprenylcysteine O-methyltransferase Ste14
MTLAFPVAPIELAMFQLLSVVFGALVIVTAIRRGRERGWQRLDPRARAGVVVQVIGIFMACIGPIHPDLGSTTPAAMIGTAVVGFFGIGAVWLFYASARALNKNWSIDARMRPDHELVRAGPYAYLRHPIYLGLLFYMLALAIAAGHYLQLIVAIPVYLWGTIIRTRVEDRLLSETFGASFDAYRLSTPALFPRFD